MVVNKSFYFCKCFFRCSFIIGRINTGDDLIRLFQSRSVNFDFISFICSTILLALRALIFSLPNFFANS